MKFKSVEEMIDELSNKTTTLELNIFGLMERFFEWFGKELKFYVTKFKYRFINKPKWFLQRGTRGYSDYDVWNMNGVLNENILGMLKQLKKSKMGVPSRCVKESDGDNFDLAVKRWDRILDKMILTFEIARMIDEHNWLYQPSNRYSKTLADKYRLITKRIKESSDVYGNFNGYVMYKGECKVYEQGWDLFREYFHNLWD